MDQVIPCPCDESPRTVGVRERVKRLLPAGALALVALLFLVGWYARQQLSLDVSLDALDGVREWVLGFGWRGPAVFLTLVTFRSFLLLPSAFVLVLGGLAFGALAGALLGGAGVVCSALIQYVVARVLGDEWVRPRLGTRALLLERRLQRTGAWLVALVTGHPAGPLTPIHLAAGLASMPLLSFTVAVGVGGPVRAGAYSLVGSSILDWGLWTSVGVAVALIGVALLPLAHPNVRRWIRG